MNKPSEVNTLLGLCFVNLAILPSILYGSLLAAQGLAVPSLNHLASQCFRTRRKESCQRALNLSEALQRSAEARGNYSCQTIVLGLGAELLLAQLNKGRKKIALETLQDVNNLCDGL